MRFRKQNIFLVDDEPGVLKGMARALSALGCEINCFESAPECLKQLRSLECDLLVTDVRMPEMDGIELLTEARKVVPYLPVLVVTAYADVQLAVKALKAGAVDFIEKPLIKDAFLNIVETTLKQSSHTRPLAHGSLTKTEMLVLKLISDGKTNKEIARALHRSRRTVDDHRYHIMYKFNAYNVVDLVKKACVLGLVDITTAKADLNN